MIKRLAGFLSQLILRYLEKTTGRYEPFSVTPPEKLARTLRPGDVLLIEGNTRIASIIKYLTQSTWSHAALYVGEALKTAEESNDPPVLIEALPESGVVAAPLSKYAHFNTRICRAAGLNDEERQKVVDVAVASLGKQYDVANILDLARYLIPHPPVPIRFRRRLLAFGSGDATRAICSTLIAQAFQSIRYPVLPHVRRQQVFDTVRGAVVREILHIRHYSLYTPRDFDISPYFRVVKPTIETGFDFHTLVWDPDMDEPGKVAHG